ncbi:MAG TPA: PQQ-dependent sugar dehydrogenase [Gammaproteobacteria bacterium]|nr:PQQ-dependent sugar dehydrogenase [Gammaproteobacteria bacterium]
MRLRRRHLLVCVGALLTACGGGGGGSSSNNPPPPGSPPAGLDARPANATCVAPAKTASGAGSTIALQRVFGGVALNQPLAMLQAPGDDSRWFVLEKTGAVRVFANTANVATASTFLSLTVNSNPEGGLLGMAFHPGWATNHYAYVSFTEGSPMVSVIARFTSTDGGATLNPGTRQDVLKLNQPYDNHNGGNLGFGPDGNLYIGFGDGGSGGDPQGHAQNTQDMLGDFLRINVDGAVPYTIPADNPFAASGVMCTADFTVKAGNCKQIYASGVRNPWRWSFDRSTGELWAGDVGQNQYEEIDRIVRGGNYGWNCREGTHAYADSAPAAACAAVTGLIEPVIDYDHSEGNSVTGGYVYRGSALPALAGAYLFADYGSGRIWRLAPSGGAYTKELLLDTGYGIASFGQGNDGELYVVDLNGGALYKIVDGGGGTAPASPVPTSLADTGCVNPQNPGQPAAGLIPYAPAAAFWSDGATKDRWLAIPNGTSIAVGADGDFTFPSGSVLVKNFRLNGALIETRLFMRHPDGEWAGYTYEWNAQQTAATLVTGGKTVTIGGQSWRYPSGDECNRCHTQAAGYALGPEAAQLNHDFVYASTGRTANELRTLDSISMFSTPLGDPANQPAMPDPADTTAPIGQRARAYLHTNCSQCHRPGGGTPSSMDLRYSTLLSATAACDAPPQAGDLGIGAAARIVAPGSPANSVLVARANRRDANGMPPLASSVVDAAGVALLTQWIAGLTSCQ